MMSFLESVKALPKRSGPPPKMTAANPQEQLEQFPENWGVIEELTAYAFSLADVKEMPTQIAPPGSRAMTLYAQDATTNRAAFMVDLEFAHIHNPPIGSMHLTLPIAIREAAIERGWALRHPLAIKAMVSPDIVFVFAPRTTEELKAASLLLRVSHAYAKGIMV
jgi:hypothetical protein